MHEHDSYILVRVIFMFVEKNYFLYPLWLHHVFRRKELFEEFDFFLVCRLFLIGHSAGAHLVASMMTQDWQNTDLATKPFTGINCQIPG